MKTNIKTIIVPTDFTKKSDNALKTAVHIALRHNAKIVLFHIVETYYLIDRGGKQVIGSETVQQNIDVAKRKLKTIKATLSSEYSKLKISVQIKIENIVDSVNDLIAEEIGDLVVMGTSGRQGWKEFVLGSHSYLVLSNANCSVMLVPENSEKYDFKNILFPVRVSENIDEKLKFCLLITEKNDSNINVLGVCNEDNIKTIKEEFLKVRNKLNFIALKHRSKIVYAFDNAKKISDFSEKTDADLLFLNYEDEQRWKSFFAENFFKKIINYTDIPLFFLKPKIVAERFQEERYGSYDLTMPIPI
ncbi:universal stress protein [Candidatus Kaistella beijingensis]|uniref:universal stress protein n=1 Tax=Candidatus Kaistella beijingensis TaxID=2820270 RepID=UPI001CC6ECDA|nr:universal stress protein [Candidatus Kaistella beijingensis]UBB90384.1 universal stress protein [Candidatus Kaistella beijingensis]